MLKQPPFKVLPDNNANINPDFPTKIEQLFTPLIINKENMRLIS